MTNNEMLKSISDQLGRIELDMKKMMERISELELEIKKSINWFDRTLPPTNGGGFAPPPATSISSHAFSPVYGPEKLNDC